MIRRQKGEKRKKNQHPSLLLWRLGGLFLSVVRPFEQKVASISEESVFALARSGSDQRGGGLPGRFCLTQHRLAPLIWSHFAWLHPDWLPVGADGGSHRRAGGAWASLGAGGGTLLGGSSLTPAPSPTVSPLVSLLKPATR